MKGVAHIIEPFWNIQIEPTPLERELLEHPYLKHLSGIHHVGLAACLTPIRHTRLTHTLGIYTLCAHFLPDDKRLRAAALLHDVGHVAFSHAAEAALGIGHHARTLEAVKTLAPLLETHDLEVCEVKQLIDGPSPLRPGSGKLGLDHLESFVRCGLSETGCTLLEALSLVGNTVSVTAAAAPALLELIERELLRLADKSTVWTDRLSGELLKLVRPTDEDLWTLSDDDVLTEAQAHPEGKRLLSQLHRQPEGTPGEPVSSRYANYPLVDGMPATVALAPQIRRLEARLAQLPSWRFAAV